MDASPPIPIPRLRISRFSPQHRDQSLNTPLAGSSHNPDLLNADEDDEDAESTPRMSASAIPDRQSPRISTTPGLATHTPADRLRAVLARIPNSPGSATPVASSSRPPVIPSMSEPDSDFEPPYSTVTASSVARESLKELFMRATREPGDTPRKGKPRRNSIDTSEVESTSWLEESRARYKGKRRSLSDEEAEKSKHNEPSEQSFRTNSAASTFDALRKRLVDSSAMPTLPPEQMVMDMSMPPINSSMDGAAAPAAPVDTSSETPPYATSTPMRTFQMSAHLHMQSNLLDQDSEWQNALEGMDSYEVTSNPAPTHKSSMPSLRNSTTPPTRPQSHALSHARPLSWSSHSKSHSINKMPPIPPSRHSSEDMDASSSRASSSLSGADCQERQDDVSRERLHDRERGWNSPAPKTPTHPGRHDPSHRHSWGSPGSGRGSPAHRLTRKGSAASLTSTDDGRSSRASSVASRADRDERMSFVAQERNKDREREWNKPHPKLSRSSSSLSLNTSERLRTMSQPTRPDSAASYLSPNRLTLHRHSSSNSLSSSSRPNSPAGSVSSHHSLEVEVEHELEHQRERNWNSPHPKWSAPLHHRRSLSPLPSSPAGSPPASKSRFGSTIPRSRNNSIAQVSAPNTASMSVARDKIGRPKSPLLRSTADNKPFPSARPHSPAPPTPPERPESSLAGYQSHFGWSFPSKRAPLPPLELDQDSPRKPLSRQTSRSSLSDAPSHIPIRSPRKSITNTSSSVAPSVAPQPVNKRGHRRSVTELAESIGSLPPRIEVTSDDVHEELPPIPIVNGRDDSSSSSASEDESMIVTSTPTVRPKSLPPPEVTSTPIAEPPVPMADGFALQLHDGEAQDHSGSSLVSPPPTPPASDAQTMFSLQTPPRRPQFSTPRVDFETPPPPRGMPDLPGPPSEDEENDHTSILQSRDIQGDITALKTPRPPGAWLATPAPSRYSSKEPVERAGSAPPAAEHMSGSDSGLATPPATFSRATSLPPQTPAPPGGWVNTPVPDTSARKKVRFDVESETASDGTLEKRSADSSVESQVNDIKPPSWGAGTLQNGDASTTSSAPAEESSVEPPPTPPSLRQRIRQKSPSIRLLDAYGREQVETAPSLAPSPAPEPETAPQDAGVRVADDQAVAPATPRRKTSTGRAATPRSRSTVRMVDAMGREIQEDPVPEDDSFASPPLSRSEALFRMQETLSSMAQELSEVDGSSDNTVFDARSYAALEERCKSSQLARSKISKSLQRAHSAEAELKSKYTPLRDRVKQYAIPAHVSLPRSFGWRLFALFVLLQLVLLAIYYRYSIVQARKIFLTTYYDPFYPELYRYLVKPDTTQHTIPPCPSWSVFSAFSSLQRAGFKGVAADAWASTSCSIASYLQSFWVDVNYAQDTVRHSWPPT